MLTRHPSPVVCIDGEIGPGDTKRATLTVRAPTNLASCSSQAIRVTATSIDNEISPADNVDRQVFRADNDLTISCATVRTLVVPRGAGGIPGGPWLIVGVGVGGLGGSTLGDLAEVFVRVERASRRPAQPGPQRRHELRAQGVAHAFIVVSAEARLIGIQSPERPGKPSIGVPAIRPLTTPPTCSTSPAFKPQLQRIRGASPSSARRPSSRRPRDSGPADLLVVGAIRVRLEQRASDIVAPRCSNRVGSAFPPAWSVQRAAVLSRRFPRSLRRGVGWGRPRGRASPREGGRAEGRWCGLWPP